MGSDLGFFFQDDHAERRIGIGERESRRETTIPPPTTTTSQPSDRFVLRRSS